MARLFQDLCREALEDGGRLGLAALWARTLPELLFTALKERSTMLNRNAYLFAVGVALAAALILVWSSLGVGIIGADGDPARALFATALAQALVAAIALILGLGLPWSPPVELLALNGFFVALFVGSALLFRHAGRGQTPAGVEPEG
jgi:drug/metabolite transporter (DMT)-like permease